MHLVVELFFDQATETAIRALWRTLVEQGVSLGFSESAARPHVSLTVYQELEIARFQSALAVFAGVRTPLDVTMTSWGVFATSESVVYLVPVVTRELLVLHRDFHRLFAAFGAAQPYYLPDSWVPHCTLAAGVPSDLLPTIAEVCRQVAWPRRGRLESIGLVEYYPRREYVTFRFGA